MQHRPEIDGLRAVAVLPVVLFHAGAQAISGGYVGVDVFFVISGFLITGLLKSDLERGRFSILGFYNRRVRRILPALIFTAALTSVAAFAFLLPSFLVDYAKSLVSVATFVSNFYFWKASGYFENSALLRPMLHTWSLAVEEQFYIFMPVAAFVVFRFFGKRWLLIFGAAALASFALSIYATSVAPTANFFLLPTRAWELLLGALLAVKPPPRGPAWLANVLSLLGLALILGSVFAYDETTPFPGLAALAPCAGTALIIAFADPGATLVGRGLTLKPVVFIGLISYSLYLVHWPIAVFWRYLTLEPPNALGTTIIFLASVLLAAASWRWIEQPFRRRGGASNLRVIAVGAGALVCIGVVGGLGWAASGLPQRFPAQAPVETAEDAANSWRNGVCFLDGSFDTRAWSESACVINPNGSIPTLLWGDSFAAHYTPGLDAIAPGTAARIYEYTAAGCPPVLDYYSYARPGCTTFNANALQLIDRLHIRRVVLAARWEDMRSRGLEHLRSTIDALAARHVDVFVIGQSPMFITDVAVIAGRTNSPSWPISIDADINRQLRAIAHDAHFIDPLAVLCAAARCPYRNGDHLLFWDYGHFSAYGSAVATRAYFPLGAGGGTRTPTP